jgi:hypothetical protein
MRETEMNFFDRLLTPLEKARADACREYAERMQADGWEFCDEGGGLLWQLHRGYRYDHVVVDVQIDPNGKAFWFKTAAAAEIAPEPPVPMWAAPTIPAKITETLERVQRAQEAAVAAQGGSDEPTR